MGQIAHRPEAQTRLDLETLATLLYGYAQICRRDPEFGTAQDHLHQRTLGLEHRLGAGALGCSKARRAMTASPEAILDNCPRSRVMIANRNHC